MKVLIWILSAFVIVLLNELLGLMIGYKLGYILVFALVSAVAGGLCKTLIKDDGKAEKKKVSGGKKGQAIPAAPVPGGWTCAKCGASHDPATNFCDKCGTPKGGAPVQSQQPAYEPTRPQPIEPPKPMEPIVPVQPAAPIKPVQPAVPVPPVAPVAPAAVQQPVPQPQYHPYPAQPPVQPYAPQSPAAPVIRFYVSSLNTEVSVTRPSFTVGRDATSDLSLARLPNAKYIARRQASFFCSGGKWYIRDENSTNGTFLNNKQLQGQVPHPLNQGDFISFAGKETLIVQHMS